MTEQEIRNNIAKNIIELRKNRGLTCAEVARNINKTREAYTNYETARRTIPTDTLFLLSQFYNVSIDDIVENTVTVNRENAIAFESLVFEKNSLNNANKLIISKVEEKIIFVTINDYTLDYYLKNSIMQEGIKQLVLINGTPSIVFISISGSNVCVFDELSKKTNVYTKRLFHEKVIILGDYAGSINKNIKIPNFFE